VLLIAELYTLSIIYCKLTIIRAIAKVGKHPVPARAACCYLCMKFTELF